MIKTRQALDFEQYLAKRLVINGDLTQAQRQANLVNLSSLTFFFSLLTILQVNGTEVFLNFMLPFEMMDSAMLPLITLSNKMRVNFKTEPLQNIITTPNSGAGGAPPTTYTTTGQFFLSSFYALLLIFFHRSLEL